MWSGLIAAAPGFQAMGAAPKEAVVFPHVAAASSYVWRWPRGRLGSGEGVSVKIGPPRPLFDDDGGHRGDVPDGLV